MKITLREIYTKCKKLEEKILKDLKKNNSPKNKNIDKLRYLRELWVNIEKKKIK